MPEKLTFKQAMVNIAVAYAAAWLWVTTVVAVLSQYGLATIKTPPIFSAMMAHTSALPWLGNGIMASVFASVFMTVVFAPVVEEAFCRMLVLEFAAHYSYRFKVAAVYVLCGLGFGLLHGHPINILIQGVVGAIAGVLYLRNGRNSMLSGYASCVLLHAAYNYTVLMNS